MVAGKGIAVTILDHRTPLMDMKLVAATFESIAKSLESVPITTAIYHPTLGIVAEPLETKFWYDKSGHRNISYMCWNNGRTGDTSIYAYPSGFQDTAKALADITGHFEKSASLKIGKTQRAKVSGGEALWTEQPGSQWPFLAAVRRDGRVYFVSANAVTASGCTRPVSKTDVLAVAGSLRSWDGK